MKLLFNGNRALTGHLWSLNEVSSTRIQLHLIELLDKGVPRKPLKNLGCCQDYRSLSTNWRQGPNAKDNIYTIHWTWRSWSGAYIEPLHLQASVLGAERYSAWRQKRNVNTTIHKPFDLKWCTACKVQWWHKACEHYLPMSDLTEGSLYEIEPIHDTVSVTMNQRLDSPGT